MQGLSRESLHSGDVPATPREFPINTVKDLLETKGEENADELFVIEEESGDELTYGEILEQSETVASALIEHGVAKGDIVAGLVPNSLDHLRLWFGCVLMGAVWAPINTKLETDDLQNTLIDIEPNAMVVEDSSVAAYEKTLDGIPEIQYEFSRDAALSGSEPITALTDFDGSNPLPDVEPHDDGGIIFTGGTTGRPKPVLLSQFSVLGGAYRYAAFFEPEADDRHLFTKPLCHIGPQQAGVIGPMLCDISTVLVKEFSASSFFHQVNEHEATLINPISAMWGALLKAYDEPIENTARRALWSMEPEFVDTARELFDIEYLLTYGQTETGGVYLFTTHDEYMYDQAEYLYQNRDAYDTEGFPAGYTADAPWAEVAILDDNGLEVPTGEKGEICFRPLITHTFMEWYYNRPEKTVEVWDGLWHHTGDLGRVDEEGVLYYMGRELHWLRHKGENVSCIEVERTLNAHPAVDESCVVGVPNKDIGGQDAKAFVKLEDDLEPEELVEWAAERLADFKVPRYVEFIETFPRSETQQNIKRNDLSDRGIGDAWDREQA